MVAPVPAALEDKDKEVALLHSFNAELQQHLHDVTKGSVEEASGQVRCTTTPCTC